MVKLEGARLPLLLLVTMEWSRSFLLKAPPQALIYANPSTKAGATIDAVAPQDGIMCHALRKAKLNRAIRLLHAWQMLIQSAGMRTSRHPSEIHCRGCLCVLFGLVAKRLHYPRARLIIYLNRSEIDRVSSRLRRQIASFLINNADYVLVETMEDRAALSAFCRNLMTKLLVIDELIKGQTILAGLYMHPERIAMLPYCTGTGIDVGCGGSKTHPDATGIDITPLGQQGRAGSEIGRASQADVCASGDDLALFESSSLDYIVARHNIEHYPDPVKVLTEWRRVLKPRGTMALVVPDDEVVDTLALDPTHYRAFTRNSFRDLVQTIPGLQVREIETCIPGWSFKCVIEKTG